MYPYLGTEAESLDRAISETKRRLEESERLLREGSSAAPTSWDESQDCMQAESDTRE